MDALPHTQSLLKELNDTAAEAGALLRDEAELFVRGVAQTLLLIPVLLFLLIGLWVALNLAASAITHAYTGSMAWAASSVVALHSIAALIATERRDALERTLSQQLAEQARQVRTTPRLREFLIRDWARVLTESMLRYGDNDERTVSAVKTADDLLWSLHIPDHPQSRQRLLGLLPDLLKRLRAGMALVGLPETQQQAVLDELMVVHTESLRPGERASTREATPQEIFQRLRDEAPSSSPPPSAQGFVDSLIEVFSMDTVPAELMSDGNPPAAGPDRPIDAMAPGSSCRWFLSGRWRAVQLLWRSDSLNYFVFAGETAGRTHSITRQALARLVTEGLVKPVSDTQLIQRVVHRVMRDLATSH